MLDATIEKQVEYEETSCLFWSEHLGRYASHLRTLNDRCAVAAAVLSTLTAAGIWTVVARSSSLWAQGAVTLVSVAAAVVALLPKQMGYSEGATTAAALAGDYYKHLVAIQKAHADVKAGVSGAEEALQKAREAFSETRQQKEELRPYPNKLRLQADDLYESVSDAYGRRRRA